MSSFEAHSALGQRQKRRQVARACDRCRAQRIKCDNSPTCGNCRAKGEPCSNSNGARATTLSQAHRVIDHLSSRVKELEAELERERKRSEPVQRPQQDTFSSSPPQPSPSSGIGSPYYGKSIKKYWDGIQIQPARLPHSTWFGASSLYYFVSRLSVFLNASFGQTQSADALLPLSVSSLKLLDGPVAATDPGQMNTFSYPELTAKGLFLTSVQEEYFISLYWHSFHTSLYFVIDETDFKKHYQSLWSSSTTARRPSALVDIVIAMCMQYGILSQPPGQQSGILENVDAAIAGRWHFRRGQMLLACEMESPTVETLQCHLLCAIYLCGGSFHNMVDGACGSAVRTAYQMGLHLDPVQSLPEKERQMRRRLWWSTYLIDSKVGMKFGRPFLVDPSHNMPELPQDDLEAAMASGSMFAPIGGGATWLSYNLHLVKLYATAREVHSAFFGRDLEVSDGLTVWDDLQTLEILAETLSTHVQRLDKWVRNVPDALKSKRKNGSPAFSTDGSSLEIEQYAPMWLQRQRILLELAYHHLCICLYRSLVSFSSPPPRNSLVASGLQKCAAHAVQFSKICQQTVCCTSILEGWHEAFQWQWNAAMVLVGLILAPHHESSMPEERKALDLAISVFDTFGANFTTAASAASIMRDLCSKVDFLSLQPQAQDGLPTSFSADKAMARALQGHESMVDGFSKSFTNAGNEQDLSDMMDFDLFNMAVGVDFWADLDALWPPAGHQVDVIS